MFSHAWLSGGLTNDYRGLQAKLQSEGIEMGQHHYRNDKYTIFKQFKSECPNMDRLVDKYYFVPSHHMVSLEEAHKIGTICKSYM
jgi:dTDP-4-amino-4,6-dideoxygalactose transaminase